VTLITSFLSNGSIIKLWFFTLTSYILSNFMYFKCGSSQISINTTLNFNCFDVYANKFLRFALHISMNIHLFLHLQYHVLENSEIWCWDTVPLMFKVFPNKIGVSLQMEAFQPHMRQLYRLRAVKERVKLLCLTACRCNVSCRKCICIFIVIVKGKGKVVPIFN
jgi:hypothetical protein